MANGTYSVVSQRVAVTAAQDLALLVTGSGSPIEIVYAYVGQSSDFGDAQDELLALRWRTGMTTNGSGGSAPTPQIIRGDAACAATARVNDTTASSTGTILELHEECWNVRAGWVYFPPPESRIKIGVSAKLALNLPVAPADSLTVSITIVFRELA